MSEARDAILSSIREHLRGVQAPPAPDRSQVVARPDVGHLMNTFSEAVEALGGTVFRVSDEVAARVHLHDLVQQESWNEVALSDSPWLHDLQLPGAFDGSTAPRERLFDADVGVSFAQAGVAETGTLVLVASRERHRLVSLVPPVHVAILRRSNLAPTLDFAMHNMRDDEDEGMQGHLTTLITGPSRTADIELTLVVGVHGPRRLHVVLIDDLP